MEGEELDKVAQALQDAWTREMHGTKIKWGHIGPEERSVWRHVARVAESILKDGGKPNAPAKPAPKPMPKTPFPAKR